MDEVRDVAGISVPFTVGVAIGMWLSTGPWREVFPPGIQSLIYLSFAAVCISVAAHRIGWAWFAAAYLMTGAFCAAASSTGMAPRPETHGPASVCASSLKSLIESIPFESEDTAALIKALLTGDKSGLSRETINTFRSSGAAHILALSGLHIGIIYLIISKCFSIFGNSISSRRIRCGCVIVAAGFYTLMTGAGPSICRAFLFICIRELSGIATGRKQEPSRTLLICLTVQLALSPEVIRSVGFQLSYLAMCGIVTVLPALQSWYPEASTRLGRLDPMRWIWNAAALAISCQLFTAPLSWLRFHSFPRFFLITNITALPLTTLVMFLSVTIIALRAMGLSPSLLIQADERLISILTGVLETICTL